MLRRFGFLLAALLIAAAPAAAQDDKPVSVNIGGGYTGVHGAAADHIGNAGNFTLGAIFKVSPVFSVQGEYGWNGMSKKQVSLPVSATPFLDDVVDTPFYADGNMQYFDVNALVHAHTSGKTQPYGVLGLGYYHRPVNITTPAVGFTTICDPYWYVCYPAAVPVDQIVGERSSNDFGMNFGGGVNYRFTDAFSMYFEIRYHYIWGPTIDTSLVPSSGAPSSLKANGQFLPITVGFRF